MPDDIQFTISYSGEDCDAKKELIGRYFGSTLSWDRAPAAENGHDIITARGSMDDGGFRLLKTLFDAEPDSENVTINVSQCT
jgi:hypothetical protein